MADRHDHSAPCQPHKGNCFLAWALAAAAVRISSNFGLCATAGEATTMLTAKTATAKHR